MLWPVILAGVNRLLVSLLSGVVVKFVVFTAMLFLTSAFVEVLQSAGVFPTSAGLNTALVDLPPEMWYFLDLFAVPQGLQIVLSALVSRFILRRVPVIG